MARSERVGYDPDYMFVTVKIDPLWLLRKSRSTATKTYGELWRDRWARFEPPWSEIEDPTEFSFPVLQREYSETMGVTYSPETIPGREENFQSYTGGDNRTISMALHLEAEYASPETQASEEEGNPAIPILTDMERLCPDSVVYIARWFERLKRKLLDVDEKLSHSPPPVLLYVGALMVARCICTDCTITWVGPFVDSRLFPKAATVQLTFTVVRAAPYSEDDYDAYVDSDTVPPWNRDVAFEKLI